MRRAAVYALGAWLLLLTACGGGDGDGGGGGTGGGAGSSGGGGGSGVVLTVYVADEVVAEWTLSELEEAVTFVSFELDGDLQTGPRLLDVIAASGVEQWRTGEVLGKGEGRSFDIGLEISNPGVDDAWILDVTNRGTLKLAAPDLPREQWVRDAGEIRLP